MITKISKKQAILATAHLTKKSVVIASGSIRVGKSMFLGYSFAELTIMNALENKKPGKFDNRYAIICHSYDNVFNNVWVYVQERLESFGFEIKPATGGKIAVKGKREITFLFFGGDNKSSYKKLQTAGTFRSCFIDEAGLINEETIQTAFGRVINYKDARIFMATNPEGGPTSPFRLKYMMDPDNLLVEMVLLDNPEMEQNDVERLRKVFSTSMFQRKVLGRWVTAEGAIYEQQPIKYHNLKPPRIKYDYITVGIDEGRKDAVAMYFIGVDKDGFYDVFDGYYWKNGDLQRPLLQHAFHVREKLNEVNRQHKCKLYFHGETNPGFLTETLMYDKELDKDINVQYVKKRIIITRIQMVQALIGLDRLYINSDLCPELITAFENAIYKNDERLDDGTSNIDSLDAFEYALCEEEEFIMQELVYKGL